MQNLSTNLPLVRLNSVNPFLLELARRNLDGGAILRKMGLPGQVPVSSELFASSLTVYEIVEEAAIAAGDPHIGHSTGQKLDLAHWPPIANAVRDAGTVGDLLRFFIVNVLEHTSATEFFLRTQGERSTFGFVRVVHPTFPPAQNDAFYVGFFSKLLCQATGDNWVASSVLAVVADPDAIPSGREYPRISQGDYSGMQISFPTSWQFSAISKSAFSVQQNSFSEQQIPESLVVAVRVAIWSHINETDLNVERVAGICGYNKRKLSKLLREQGTTIVKEISALRAEIAREKLADSKMRIAKIGESVGFRDPTVFSRAFKNWTGQSPQEFRRNNRTT